MTHRHWGITAAGQKAVRGDQPSGPRSEPIHGSNVIQLADHHRSLPDDRSTSGAPVAAASFLQDPFEFGSLVFTIAFFTAPSIFVGGAILFYALMVA